MSEYIGWWLLIPAVVIMVLQIPGCTNKQDIEKTKQIKIMTEHCTSIGKSYVNLKSNSVSSDGFCV